MARRRASCWPTAPAGMTVDPSTGLITWNTPSTSPATVAGRPLRLRSQRQPHEPGSSWSRSPAAAIPRSSARCRPRSPARRASRWCSPSPPPTPTAARWSTGPTTCPAAPRSTRPPTPCSGSRPTAQAGTYNDVTFYVSDGVSTVSTSVTLLIAPAPPPPQLAAPPDQTVREGDHLRFTLQGSDADGGPVTYSSTDLPENATLDPNTGVFDWPIGYDQAGTINVSFTATSSSGVSTTQIGHLHRPGRPRRAGVQRRSRAGRSPRGSRSRSSPWPSTRTTRPSCCRRVCPTARSLPTRPPSRPSPTPSAACRRGRRSTPTPRSSAGRPANHQNGTYNVVFTATNDGTGGPLSTSVTVPITVSIVNHAPVVTPIADITLTAGQPFDQAVMAIDPDGNPMTLSVAERHRRLSAAGLRHAHRQRRRQRHPPLQPARRQSRHLHADRLRHRQRRRPRARPASSPAAPPSSSPSSRRPSSRCSATSATRSPSSASRSRLTSRPAEADQDNLTYSVAGLPRRRDPDPRHLLRPATLNWTPTAADTGAYQVTFTVTDTGNGTTQPSSTTQTIRLVVRANDTAPIFPATAPTATVAEGQALEPAGHRHQAGGRPAHLHGHGPARRRQPRPGDRRADLDAPARPGRQLRRRR